MLHTSEQELSLAFVDEAGLTRDPAQLELGIGALIVHQHHLVINQQLRNILLVAVTRLGAVEELFEFKFTFVTPNSLPYYQKLLAVMAGSINDWAFIYSIEPRDNRNFWDQYLAQLEKLFSSLNNQHIVLADYLNRPRRSQYGLSDLEGKGGITKVLQLESQGTIFLQMADVLLGALMFERRGGKDLYKAQLAAQVRELLNKKQEPV